MINRSTAPFVFSTNNHILTFCHQKKKKNPSVEVFQVELTAKFGISKRLERGYFPCLEKKKQKTDVLWLNTIYPINLRFTLVKFASSVTQTHDGSVQCNDCAKAAAGFIPRLCPYVQVFNICPITVSALSLECSLWHIFHICSLTCAPVYITNLTL